MTTSTEKRKRVKLPGVQWAPMRPVRRGYQARLGNYILSVTEVGPLDVDVDQDPYWRWLVNYVPSTNGPDKSSWAMTADRAMKAAVKAYVALSAKCP